MNVTQSKIGATSRWGRTPRRTLIASAAALIGTSPLASWAQQATVDALDQRIRVLERQLEVQKEEADAKAKTSYSTTLNEKGLEIKSASGDYSFKLRGLFQADTRFYIDNDSALYPYNDGTLLRRVEPSFEFTLGKIAYFKVVPEFTADAATTADVFGELRFTPAANLRVGKFKEPIGLEQLQSSAGLALIERSYVNEVSPNRDYGIQLGGEFFASRLSYAIGWFNGAPDGRDAASSDVDNRKETAARIFAEPFKNEPGLFQGLGFGIGGSYGVKDGTGNNLLPRYRSQGQNQVFSYNSTVAADGEQTRWSPQAYWYYNSLGLLAEYIASEQELSNGGPKEKIENTAYQVEAVYVLTGEDAGYRGVAKPKQAFKIGGPGWGAFEVAARYTELEIDDDAFTGATPFADLTKSISAAKTYGLGLNWYVNANLKLVTNYTVTKFDDGGATGDREDEKAIFTRFQVAF